MPCQTKIVATLGPATDRPGVLKNLISSGVNVVRLNFSHGKIADHATRAKAVRQCAKELGTIVAILGDLQGPKFALHISPKEKCNLEMAKVLY